MLGSNDLSIIMAHPWDDAEKGQVHSIRRLEFRGRVRARGAFTVKKQRSVYNETMFETDKTLQNELFGLSFRDVVPPESDVWTYIDLFEGLDLEDFKKSYQAQGQSAKEPRLVLQVLFYGLTHGIVSARKLEIMCRNDNRFIVLSGNVRPDRRTLDRFIRRHEKHFGALFVQVVRLAQELGMVSLGKVAIDGSKFKAQANQSIRYDQCDVAVKEIQKNVKRLKKDLALLVASGEPRSDEMVKELRDSKIRKQKILEAKKKIEVDFAKRKKKRPGKLEKQNRALADPDALQVAPNKGFFFGYNVQAAVDEKSQIVVAADVHDKQSDYNALTPMVDQVKENCQDHPEGYLMDSGYQSLDNIKKVNQTGSKAYINRKTRRAQAESELNEQIEKGNSDREYFCMDKRKMDLASRNSNGTLSFRMTKYFCKGCDKQDKCSFYGKRRPDTLDDENRRIYTDFLERSRTDEFQKTLAQRKAIVEPVFGNIKNKGMRIFVRGKTKVECWWKMATTAHNIEKIVKHVRCQQI